MAINGGPAALAETRPAKMIEVETPEHVRLEYPLADFAARGAALAVDLLCLGLLVIAARLALRFGLGGETFLGDIQGAVLIPVISLGPIAYMFLFEAFWGGRTPGKQLLGLRVMHLGGEPLSVSGAALRNFIRLIDLAAIPPGLLGMAMIALSRRAQRLGDLAAGTVVVRERAARGIGSAESREVRVPERSRLGAEAYDLLAAYLDRRQSLAPARRQRVRTQVALAVGAAEAARDAEDLDRTLSRIHAEQTQLRASLGWEGRSGQAARLALEKHESWEQYDQLLEKARRSGLSSLNRSELSSFGRLYRLVTSDLARAETYGASKHLLHTLSQRASTGHGLLYRASGKTRLNVGKWLVWDLPRSVRRYATHTLVAAACLFGPGLAAMKLGMDDPILAREMSGPGMVERAENTLKGDRNAPYVPAEKAGASFASFIISNNVQVAAIAFAGGVFAGVFTLQVLIYNGIVLGFVHALYANEGLLPVLLGFVMPHGFLELAAIAMAGGGGLGMGLAVLRPGRRSRSESLIREGGALLSLLAASATLLLAAGLIEGFLSPSPIPAAVKYAVGGACFLLMLAYLSFAGRNPRRVKTTAGA